MNINPTSNNLQQRDFKDQGQQVIKPTSLAPPPHGYTFQIQPHHSQSDLNRKRVKNNCSG